MQNPGADAVQHGVHMLDGPNGGAPDHQQDWPEGVKRWVISTARFHQLSGLMCVCVCVCFFVTVFAPDLLRLLSSLHPVPHQVAPVGSGVL